VIRLRQRVGTCRCPEAVPRCAWVLKRAAVVSWLLSDSCPAQFSRERPAHASWGTPDLVGNDPLWNDFGLSSSSERGRGPHDERELA